MHSGLPSPQGTRHPLVLGALLQGSDQLTGDLWSPAEEPTMLRAPQEPLAGSGSISWDSALFFVSNGRCFLLVTTTEGQSVTLIKSLGFFRTD